MQRVTIHRLLLCVLTLILVGPLFAQKHGSAKSSVAPAARKIYLVHADTLSFNKKVSADYQMLRGNVRFRQDSAYMYCDSAYFYEKSNSMDAFGRVRVEQGDSLYLFGDSLYYDGNTGLARLVDNVRLIHNNTILYTDNLHYKRFESEAYYFDGGVIIDPENNLKSIKGWYYPNTKIALFKNDVQLRNYDYSKNQYENSNPDGLILDEYDEEDAQSNQEQVEAMRDVQKPSRKQIQTLDGVADTIAADKNVAASDSLVSKPAPVINFVRIDDLVSLDELLLHREPPHASLDPDDEAMPPRSILYSDTLTYNLATGQADINGPSRIVSDSSTVYTDKGYYNTKLDRSVLYDRSYVVSPGRFAIGDTMFYNRAKGYAEIFGEVEVCDSLQHVKMTGDYVYYNESAESIMSTGHALAMEFSSKDTLYMHADTLRTFVKDSVRFMNAYYNVRYYRTDLQGVCDSLVYNSEDSTATFMGNPVMWNGQYQITGDTIFVIMADKGVEKALVHDNAFIIQEKDTVHYDQISGKDLVCYFDSSSVRQMDMSGNVQIIYYPEESDRQLIGLNQMIGNYLTIWFQNRKMDRLRVWPDVVGSLTPIPLVTEDILYLSNFRWMNYLRPLNPQDVFRDVRMKQVDKQERQRLFDEDELNGY